MTIDRELRRLLDRPGTVALAFEPSGARSMPMPPSLVTGAATTIEAAGPLDALSPGSHGQAVIAYEEARRVGRGSASVRLVETGEIRRIEVFDLEEQHGCFLAVLVAADGEDDAGDGPTVLPPLRSTYELGVTGVIEAISPEFSAMLGWSEDQVVGQSSLDLIHPDDHETGIVAWIELLEKPHAETRLRQRFKTSDGRWLWCEVTDRNLLDETEGRVHGELVDISREMATHAALEQRERLLDRLSRALPSGVFHVDADGVPRVCNDRWQELTGLDQTDGLEPLLANLREPELVERAIERAVADGIDADLDVVFAAGSGSCAFGTLHLRPLREDDRHVGLLVTLDDVTSLRTYQLQLADQATRDPLTGTRNRLGVEQALEAKLISAAKRRATGTDTTNRSVAVLFIDLDRFKEINDGHGHAVGDEVLRLVATGIQDLLRAEDVVGRIGGDEFLVVLEATTTERATALVERIDAAVPSMADVIPDEVSLGASIGLAIAEPGDDFDSLLQRADQAMYRVKHRRAADDRRQVRGPTR